MQHIPDSERKIEATQPGRNYLFVIPALFAVILFYTWFVTSGGGNQSGTTTMYYAYLAEAFLTGDLHLALKPDPQLLALDNPYDVAARIELKRSGIATPMDFSLYEEKFYVYWGPVPALLLAAIQALFGARVSDFFLAFIFCLGIFLVQSFLLLAVWERYSRTLPRWTLLLAIFLGGSLWPIALLRHYDDYARIYEAAIGAGQFFLVSGILVAFTSITRSSTSNWRFVLAGSLWVLAIGTRHVLAVPVGLMVILTGFWLLRTTRSFVEITTKLASLCLPLTLGGAALAWYNWARFGSIVETGFSYALAGVDLQGHQTELFSGSYVIQNLYNYVLRPPVLMQKFPFVAMLDGREDSILAFLPVPGFYNAQPIAGLIYIFPFAVFALVPLFAFLPDLFKRKPPEVLLENNHDGPVAWLAMVLSSSFTIAFALLLVFFWAATRYLSDFVPELFVLSVIGFWQGYQSTVHKPWTKNLYMLAGIFLAGVSILMSTFLAISIDPALIALFTKTFASLK